MAIDAFLNFTYPYSSEAQDTARFSFSIAQANSEIHHQPQNS